MERAADLLEVVNDGLLAAGLEDLFNKLQMERVNLVGLFRLLVGENEVQCDLVALVHDAALAGRHSADMKAQNALDRTKVAFRPGKQLLGGVRDFRAGPENDNM